MKRIFAILLSLALVLGLCACGESGGREETAPAPVGLQIGYSKQNITPDYDIGLGGYSNWDTRISEGLVSYIYITCIAATYGDETVLLYTMDNCHFSATMANLIRDRVLEEHGIPGDRIFCGGTHTHSAPSFSGSTPAAKRYKEDVTQLALEAATEALADRAPAKLLTATHEVEGMNFVRHYIMDDGSYAGSNFGDLTNKTAVEHATDSDKRLVLVKFDREEKKDVLLVNWQAHPARATEIGYNNISADFPGFLRDEVELQTGMLCAYFTGASGNQNPDSSIKSEAHRLTYDEYGIKMAGHVVEALSKLKEIGSSGIQATHQTFTANVDHSWDPFVDKAKEVMKFDGKDNGEANRIGYQYGFSSRHQARAIISRAKQPATKEIELYAFRIGDLGFISESYEMFSDAGIYIRANSPFETTFIISGNNGYIASAEAFDYRSYEADTGTYEKGTAEKLAERYVEMLKSVK